MRRRIVVTENQPIDHVTAQEAQIIRKRLDELEAELKPRLSFLAPGSRLLIRNLVGAIQVNRDIVLDVAPKVADTTNWAGALVDLLLPPTRVTYGDESNEGEHLPARRLPDAFAELYLRQLGQALRKDGPLAAIRTHHASAPSLAGRLDVSQWVRRRALKPAEFPQYRSVLSVDNPFTGLLAAVSELLASQASNPRISSALRALSGRLRPGLAPHVLLDPAAALRDVPPQWSAYGPAWATARAVVRRIAPLRRNGQLEGLNVALEPWPLLETLLERSLHAVGNAAARQGHPGLRGLGHTGTYLLRKPIGVTTPEAAAFHVRGTVDPDGILKRGGEVIATFEAKYSTPSDGGIRSHAFQALTTAAALHSPLAVLVYPTNFEAVQWELTGFTGRPRRLVAVGLDMYEELSIPVDRLVSGDLRSS